MVKQAQIVTSMVTFPGKTTVYYTLTMYVDYFHTCYHPGFHFVVLTGVVRQDCFVYPLVVAW